MEGTVKRFIGKVLPDGHLSLPEETAKEVGSVFDVVLMPVVYGGIEIVRAGVFLLAHS
jgi:hypothetical protein